MDAVWILAWLLIGFAIGALATTLVLRGRLASREQRAIAAERRAQQAERLAELGSMTSGLAHEIKNPLSTVVLNAQLVGEEIADSELPGDAKQRLSRRVDSLGREANRLRDILTDFLRFAGRMKLDPSPHDLRTIVDELADFFQPQSDQHGVIQRIELPAEPVIANVDVGLLKQAVLNLLINAVQAMSTQPSGHPRELMVRVERAEAPPALNGTAPGTEPREEARIHVIDTGPGIETARQDAIFRPYMTNKPGGTGLGLATTRRIIEEHGGRIQLWSERGKGSDFTLAVPLAVETARNFTVASA
ncbi:MAG: ATP-binding protein [Phycisphaerae bacterium]|nr:ATP-binding protein [Phycisphaerae bacterium]